MKLYKPQTHKEHLIKWLVIGWSSFAIGMIGAVSYGKVWDALFILGATGIVTSVVFGFTHLIGMWRDEAP